MNGFINVTTFYKVFILNCMHYKRYKRVIEKSISSWFFELRLTTILMLFVSC